MKMNTKLVLGIRLVFGLLLIAIGSLAFMNLPVPDFYPPHALAFLQALSDTGYMNYVMGVIEIFVGLMFVTRKYVALGAVLLAPISVNIVLFHLFLDLTTILPGLVLFALNLFIAYTEWDKYKPLLKSR